MTRPHSRTRRPSKPLVALLAALGLVAGSACGDDPFTIRWTEAPDTVLLYSLARPELNLTSGFNFNNRVPVRIEAANATGSWDMAVDTQEGRIVVLPPGALGVTSRAGIATLPGTTFEEAEEAPADTVEYVTDRAVAVEVGTIYVIRTGQTPGPFGTRCVYYGKFQPLAADPVGGTLEFKYDMSPVCNDRRLIPPD